MLIYDIIKEQYKKIRKEVHDMEVRKRTLDSSFGIVIICDIPTELTPAATEDEVREAASEMLEKIKSLFSEYFPKKSWKIHLHSECKLSYLRTGKVYHEVQFFIPYSPRCIDSFVQNLRDLV